MGEDYRMIFRETGGPEVIACEEIGSPTPGPGEAVVRQHAIGLDFIDVYHRMGLYPVAMPSGLGVQAAGVVEAVAPDVHAVAVGQRVGYAGGSPGAYATVRALPADLLIPLPDEIGFDTAAAALLKGMTADMLVGACGRVAPGQAVLVLAASGGVGSLLVPWLKAIGATVLAHAGSAAKAERARRLGADMALSYPFEALAEAVRAATGGHGVDLVLDSVGRASWTASLAALAKRGLMVSYGNASGPPPAIEPGALARAGSLFLTRPTLFDYIDTPERRRASADRLFAMLREGKLQVEIGQRFALRKVADAHRALEGRETTGSTVLLP